MYFSESRFTYNTSTCSFSNDTLPSRFPDAVVVVNACLEVVLFFFLNLIVKARFNNFYTYVFVLWVCMPAPLIEDITLYVPCKMRVYESVFTLASSLTVIVWWRVWIKKPISYSICFVSVLLYWILFFSSANQRTEKERGSTWGLWYFSFFPATSCFESSHSSV